MRQKYVSKQDILWSYLKLLHKIAGMGDGQRMKMINAK